MTQVFTYGYFLGQLWDVFDDTGSDVTGKVRFTARQLANVDTDPTRFVHATMSVDIVSTDRRYPQLILSDQPAPVQEGMANPDSNTLLFQAIRGRGRASSCRPFTDWSMATRGTSTTRRPTTSSSSPTSRTIRRR